MKIDKLLEKINNTAVFSPYSDVVMKDLNEQVDNELVEDKLNESYAEVSYYPGYYRVHIYTTHSIAQKVKEWADEKFGADKVKKTGGLLDIFNIKKENLAKEVYKFVQTLFRNKAAVKYFTGDEDDLMDDVNVDGQKLDEAKDFKTMQKEALKYLMAAYRILSEFEEMNISGGAAANEMIGSLIEKTKKLKG